MYLTNDYKDIIEIFNKYGVKYLIAGAYAMSKAGYSRSTYDIDLWVEKSLVNAVKIYKALEEFGVPFEIKPDDFLQKDSVFQIGIEPSRIDILTDIDGVEFEDAWKNRVIEQFDGLTASTLSINELIINKSATNRPKDKLDLEQLKQLVKSKTNKEANSQFDKALKNKRTKR